MTSSNCLGVICIESGMLHDFWDDQTLTALEILASLLYLIELEAEADPEVLYYIEQTAEPMRVLLAAAKRSVEFPQNGPERV